MMLAFFLSAALVFYPAEAPSEKARIAYATGEHRDYTKHQLPDRYESWMKNALAEICLQSGGYYDDLADDCNVKSNERK